MDDVLLSYYNRELNYVRKLGAEFSEKYPKIAGRLRLDKEVVEDPHVSRLIESFAFLTARIRHSLDDSFPELTEALMGILYPDYHAPLPSMSITQFNLLPHLFQKMTIPKGESLRVETASGDSCYYKTCHDVSVLPIEINSCSLYNLPVKAPSLPDDIQRSKTIQSLLKLKISPSEEEGGFDVDDDKLRMYINAQPNIAFKLREYLSNNVIGISIARDAFDEAPLFLSPDVILSCGFSDEESVIDFDGRASSAHQLLTEYFLLPQKFLFFELTGIKESWDKYSEGFDVYIYFDETNMELIRGVDDSTLLLGCVPVVNLFDSGSEPIQASEINSEVMLHVSDQYTRSADVHRIKDVYAINAQGERQEILPFYGSHITNDEDAIYWSVRRENSSWQHGIVSHGTDSYLNFVDKDYKVVSPDSDWIINANLSCTNRDLPNTLPFGPNQPSIYFMEGGAGLRINCLTPPTPTIQPKLNEATRWQLVTQLSLQHFSNEDGLLKLKETLRLYNFNDSKDVSSLIDGMTSLDSEVITARVMDNGRSAMCQGTHFILTCDESFYTGSSLYLFGLVMDEFLSQFCAINTFTQLSIKTTKNFRIELEWPPRTGCQPLI
ncbi:MAG: type VI secretion system baseplate subunit TssF [Cellvibrionaceae bacterium]